MIRGMREFDLVLQLRSGWISQGVAPLHQTRFLVAATAIVLESDELALRALFPADRRGTQPLPALGAGELERRHIYGHLVAALVARYWNGNKRGKSGEYPWRTGQLHDGHYDGGEHLGHNVACIVVDASGEIIDFKRGTPHKL